MGSSFVIFNNRGFWSGDWTIELWLRLMVEEINKLDKHSDWLQDLRDHWDLQSRGVGTGVTWVGLDKYITTEERKETLLALAQSTLTTLEQYGEYIPKSVVRNFPRYENMGNWVSDEPTEQVKRFGSFFLKLLKGEWLLCYELSDRIEWLPYDF